MADTYIFQVVCVYIVSCENEDDDDGVAHGGLLVVGNMRLYGFSLKMCLIVIHRET